MPTAVEFDSAAMKLHQFAQGLTPGEQSAIQALVAAALSHSGEVQGFAELENYAADLNKFGILIGLTQLKNNPLPLKVNNDDGPPIF